MTESDWHLEQFTNTPSGYGPQSLSDQGVDFLKNVEGYSPNPYGDYKQTSIGYGTRALPGETRISREEAEVRLRGEASKVSDFLHHAAKVPLTQAQHDALVSFGYNLGVGALNNIMPQINGGDISGAAERMMKYTHAGGKVLPALEDRREKEAQMLLGKYSGGHTSPKNPESQYISDVELNRSFNEYAPPPPSQSNSFAKYLTESARSAGRALPDVVNYYKNLPDRTEPIGPYNTFIGAPNAFLDSAVRTATGGHYSLPEVYEAVGLPTSKARDSIQAFYNAYAPAIQTTSDIGNAGMGMSGVHFPEGGAAAVSRGAQVANNAADVSATAFENAAKNAGNSNQLNVFAPINPVDPRFVDAYNMRNRYPNQKGLSSPDIYARTNGAFFEPSGRLLRNIPDVDSRLSEIATKVQPGDKSTLGELLNHPALYEEYPEIKDIPIKFVQENTSYSRYPQARSTSDGGITVALPKEMASNPTIMSDPKMQQAFREQLLKSAQYDIERKDPLRSASFRDKRNYEEDKLNGLIDRVEYLAKNEPRGTSVTPMQAYWDYLNSFKEKIQNARALKDDPEAFVNDPLVSAGAYGKSLKAKLELKTETGQSLKLNQKQIDEAITSGIHQYSAGSLGAQYVRKNSKNTGALPSPYTRKSFSDSLVRFSEDTTDQQLKQAVNDWYKYGNAREYENRRGPYNKAEGGPVHMNSLHDDYHNRLNARNGSSIPRYADGGKVKETFHPGMTQSGNIDLTKRLVTRGPDGSVSMLRSMPVNVDGKEVLVPTTSEDGRIMSPRESIDNYTRTGKHLGIFNTPEQAASYAQKINQGQPNSHLSNAEGMASSEFRRGGRVSRAKVTMPPSASASPIPQKYLPQGVSGELTPQNPYGVQMAADGGEVTGSPDGNASISPDGVVQDPSGSSPTADAVDANVPEGSHVIPYEALVKLGDGDPELGKQVLLRIIEKLISSEEPEDEQSGDVSNDTGSEPSGAMKSGGKVQEKPKKVPIRVSNKELILPPAHVAALGRGNIDEGHHKLNAMRMKLRGAK